MKSIIQHFGVGMTTQQRQVARAQAADMLRTRGTGNKPLPPRDLYVQPGPRGILLNWRIPAKSPIDIAGYRVYKDNENSLFAEIKDPTTVQAFVESTAGASPPTTNLFVSTINQLGVESAKVQIQGVATAEASAPVMPPTPPTYTTDYSRLVTRRGINIEL